MVTKWIILDHVGHRISFPIMQLNDDCLPYLVRQNVFDTYDDARAKLPSKACKIRAIRVVQ